MLRSAPNVGEDDDQLQHHPADDHGPEFQIGRLPVARGDPPNAPDKPKHAANHAERNHQGLKNVIPFPDRRLDRQEGPVMKVERLGGLLNFYERAA